MLDHIGLRVADVAAAQAFYDKALAPLGIGIVMAVSATQTGGQAYVGYGSDGRPYFWIGAGETSTRGLHVAFTADSRAAVDAFYAAAMAAGGKDNGAPGVRAHYHPSYYGAFVLDADGHNVEAVCHLPP
jgi:catechol 2,3-dioxygenase-like lactoylglutathione lyase family enzyme